MSATTVLIAATVIVSLSALLSTEGRRLYDAFQLDKERGRRGRVLAAVDGDAAARQPRSTCSSTCTRCTSPGRSCERWYGSIRFLLFYLACAAAGSIGSFVFGGDVPSVGASGAIFGLFGVLLAAGRVHHPVDRQSRALVGQLGMLILINIVFGFAVTGIDNAAHIGGLVAGLLLGALIPPTRVQTMSRDVAASATRPASSTWPACRPSSSRPAWPSSSASSPSGLFVGTQQRLG